MGTKVILALIVLSTLIGCASTGVENVKVTTNTIPQSVPLLYCPAPLKLSPPQLPIETMTPVEKANDGRVAENYVATIIALQGYNLQLTRELDQYQKDHDQYIELAKTLDQQWFQKTGTHLQLPDTSTTVITPPTTK